MEPGLLPHTVPPYTPGVSLYGSWCKAPLINLPKLVCVCVYMCMCECVLPLLKHTPGRETGHHKNKAPGWSVSDAWRKKCEKELQREKKRNENI